MRQKLGGAVCILMTVLSFNCWAIDKALIIASDSYIDYEIPDSWLVYKKQVASSLAIQQLKIVNADSTLIEATFLKPQEKSLLKKGMDVIPFTALMQTASCSQYINGSVEAKDSKVQVESANASGYSSIYTDKGDTGFKYVTCITYVLKDNDAGIMLYGTIMSKEKSGLDYESAVKVVQSFRVRK